MAETTNIEWTDHTFNPWIGCTHVHAGCKNCYAEADMDRRRGRVRWGPNGTRSRTSDSYWKQPLKWNKQAAERYDNWRLAVSCARSEYDFVEPYERPRVFCASLADVFEDWQGPILDAQGRVLAKASLWHQGDGYILAGLHIGRDIATMDDLRRDLFQLIDATPNLDWLLLTKRPENIRRMWRPKGIVDGEATFPSDRRRNNVWLLTSVSDQATADAMIPHLLECRDLVPVLGLSCEPLLSLIDFRKATPRGAEAGVCARCGWGESLVATNRTRINDRLYCPDCRGLAGVDWVIVGGESGPGARPMNLAWAQSLVQQCKSAGVPCFVKQLGGNPQWLHVVPGCSVREAMEPLSLRDRKGGDPDEWPEELRVREFPEVANA